MQGQRPYKGNYNISQNPHIDEVLHKLKNSLTGQPARIIELGTYLGGMTYLLTDTFPNVDIITYDINSNFDLDQARLDMPKVQFNICNLFDEDRIEEIKKLVSSEGLTILLCDNGYKPKEFEIFSDALKVGDIIMAHDYAKNQEDFDENVKDKIWNWWEIQDSDIDPSCERNNLKPYMQEEFTRAAWVCKIKDQ